MVLILGNGGMLGHMLCDTWSGEFTSTDRNDFDPSFHMTSPAYGDYEWVINCIGMIKPYCHDVAKAIEVNALFPHELPPNTLQIATDCVFSGKRGNYTETDPHDADDVYGQTKSLGEAPHIKNLRCSIIGPETKNHLSLLDQFLAGNIVRGYTNHFWNGITTYHFSLICQAIIREGIELPSVQHIVPAYPISKAELLHTIKKAYKKDIPIAYGEAPEMVNRTLKTNNPEINARIWKAAGYKRPPTISDMIEELAQLKL